MEIDVNWSLQVRKRFPRLFISLGMIIGVNNEKQNAKLERLKKRLYDEVRNRYDIERLKDD